ncbi:long-chain fatty acid--CoA ligase [Salibacterium salarium]|uniref:Long-chain fatty acid--CoA ligase n=1 Tax=Salibacterium salarium TaxID=284579 RepID=A0A3R9REC0_9BACI|nr:class I adenylate-forming enzyme family protein [Salibacterium salarium]RSL33569.1 long-chain fatty acid--CoA ligase [Salibacterium salarium]
MVNNNDLTIAQLLRTVAETYPEKEVLYDLTERLTYNELQHKVERLAAGLQQLDIQKGDRVGVCLPNWNETVVIFFAVAKIGATVVPFNSQYKSHEIEYILKNSEPRALFIKQDFDTNIGVALAQNLVEHVISVRFEDENLLSYQELESKETQGITEPLIDVNNDIFCILYTSGTTGLPKGVMTAHKSVVQCANTISKEMHCRQDDVFVIPAPLFHIFGITCNLITAIATGARMVLQEKYHPKQVLQLIEQEQVTIHQGVPTMFLKELEQEDFSEYDLSSLRAGMVGAAPISPAQVRKVREKMNFNLCQSFGITETGSVTLTKHEDSEKTIAETVGKPIEGVGLQIVDNNRNPVQGGEVGEIAVHSFATMKGYYKLEEKTNDVIDEKGWFYTGDLGRLDDEGNLIFVGRQKEMIIRGGFNVYPQEIESLLTKHDKVAEAAVVGIPDETLGELVCAVVQLKTGEEASADDFKKYLAEKIAKFKVPTDIIFADTFPVTASGKIQKLKLKEQIANNAIH